MASSTRPGDRRVLWLIASFVLAFGLWEAVGRWALSAAFPPFSQTFLAFVRMTADGSLAKAYLSTAQPLLIGFALCGIIGVGFGVWMGLSHTVEWLSLPIFIILQAAPMAAVVPDTDKGRAVGRLLALHAAEGRHFFSVGLGDAANDVDMLRAVDRPILVPRPDGSFDPDLERALPHAERAPAPGPEGWSAAVGRYMRGEAAASPREVVPS